MDRLAELESLVREWFIYKKMANDEKDWFEISIRTKYKDKCLKVFDITNNQIVFVALITGTSTKEMFDKSFEYFKIEEKKYV